VEAQLVIGSAGTFQVSVNGKAVIGRKFWGFPSEEEIVAAVASVLGHAQRA